MSTALSALPDSFAAGTTVILTRSHADYSAAAGWTLKLHLAGISVLTVTGSASGAAFTFTLAAADTKDLKPGTYQWVEIAEKAGAKYQAAAGIVTVTPNLAAAQAGDLQTWEEKTLAVVEDVLAGRITNDTQSYTIHGRSVTKIPLAELRQLQASLKRTIENQKHPGRLGPRVLVSFPPVGGES